jgi:sulfate adenylyltransferase subunit 1 (EFTu-like GTPase family)
VDLLRFVTAGSVDDGKSTLIGRLLYDSKQVFEDTLASLERASAAQGLDDLNLALLTDGLRAEREQGITIDVAYRYFATPKRKFIIADSPGHVQYTRNMVTGASTAQLALILVDARKGVIEQTRRHSAITHLLGIQHLVLCINKMDLVNWSRERYLEIEREYLKLAWYEGPTLLEFLETVEVPNPARHADVRFPVQYVIRPQTDDYHDYRGYAGTLAAGVLEVGSRVTVLPVGKSSRVAAIDRFQQPLAAAESGDAVTVRLEDDIDVSRGYMLVSADAPLPTTNRFSADICWMSESTVLRPRQQFWIKHTTRRVKCLVESLDDRLDIDSLERGAAGETMGLNEIGRITVKTMEPLFADPYSTSRDTGSFVLIDPATRHTVAAGMIRDVAPGAQASEF